MKPSELRAFPRQPEGPESRYYCHFCNDTKGRLFVNWRKRKYHCFNCGASGLAAQGPLFVEKPPVSKIVSRPAAHFTIIGSGRSYLKERGIEIGFARRQGVRSGAQALNGRLLFSSRFRKKFWGTRIEFVQAHAARLGLMPKSISFGETTPWILLPDFSVPTSRPVRALRMPSCVVVEGGADALRVSQDLRVPVVCLFGKTCSEDWVVDLSKRFKNVYVMLDADAITATRKLVAAFSVFADSAVSHQWEGSGDPASRPDEVEHVGYVLERAFHVSD